MLDATTSPGCAFLMTRGADVHGDSRDVIAGDFAFAGVEAGANLHAAGVHRVANRARASHRLRRRIEQREEVVAERD